ncbi:MAG: (2Fe-2S)-binding protein [Acetobacteraceae bacterium]|nr:(2Fe-2S)-binding protein [Acetobacteraceae bacterium]
MYICLCNGLTDTQVAAAVAAGARRPKAVYEACGGRAQCGGCTRTILAAIREVAARQPGPLGGVWFARACPAAA